MITEVSDDETISLDNDINTGTLQHNIINIDVEINADTRSLNKKQRETFDVIMRWSRGYAQNLSAIYNERVRPICLLITGDGGCG